MKQVVWPLLSLQQCRLCVLVDLPVVELFVDELHE